MLATQGEFDFRYSKDDAVSWSATKRLFCNTVHIQHTGPLDEAKSSNDMQDGKLGLIFEVRLRVLVELDTAQFMVRNATAVADYNFIDKLRKAPLINLIDPNSTSPCGFTEFNSVNSNYLVPLDAPAIEFATSGGELVPQINFVLQSQLRVTL